MKNLAFIFLGLLIISCSTQTVSIDYDREQDFSQIKNYHFEFEESAMNELDINRLKNAVNQELSTKGLTESSNGEIKLRIIPEEFISENQSSSVGIGMGGGNAGFGTSVGMGIPINSEKLNQHYLVSMITNEGKLVWEGQLDIQMPINASPETREINIQKGVAKLFKNYPPK